MPLAFSQKEIAIPHYPQIISPLTWGIVFIFYLIKSNKDCTLGKKLFWFQPLQQSLEAAAPLLRPCTDKGGWWEFPSPHLHLGQNKEFLGPRQVPRTTSSCPRALWDALDLLTPSLPQSHQTAASINLEGTEVGGSNTWAFSSCWISSQTFFLVQNIK